MKKIFMASLFITLSSTSAQSFAEDGISFNLALTTDYRYRGISQTRLKPALAGGVDYAAGGFYAGVWSSTIKWVKDAGGDSNLEIDLYGGYKGEVTKDFSYDVGILTYQYPTNKLNPSANTTELYGALSYGPVTAKYSRSVSNLFGFSNSKGSGYLDLTGSFEIKPGISLVPHIGRQTIKSNSGYSYTDYSIGLTTDAYGFTWTGALVGTNTDAYVSTVKGKNLGKEGIVLSVKKTF